MLSNSGCIRLCYFLTVFFLLTLGPVTYASEIAAEADSEEDPTEVDSEAGSKEDPEEVGSEAGSKEDPAEVDSEADSEEDPAEEGLAGSNCVKATSKLNSTFDSLSTQFTGGTTLVSSEIFEGYAAFTRNRSGRWYAVYPKALGIRATASAIADTSTESDYGNTSLLLRDGAPVGLTFSLMGSPYWGHFKGQSDCVAETDKNGKKNVSNWARNFSSDRYYLADHPVLVQLLRAYIVHGVTLKAIKGGLVEANENGEDKGIDAAGTFYFGLGLEGPVGAFGQNSSSPTAAGTLDVQVGWQKTLINETTLQNIYDDPSIDDRHFESTFASLKVQFTDHFYIDIEHVSPQGARRYMDDVTSFRLGYTLDKD